MLFADYTTALTSFFSISLPYSATVDVSLGALAIFGILITRAVRLYKSVGH